MPFDGSPHYAASFDLWRRYSADRHIVLRSLARALRDPTQWPAGFAWDYSSCNTCAVGLARRLRMIPERRRCSEGDKLLFLAHHFGLPVATTNLIFFDLNLLLHRDVAPDDVADAIDNAVEAIYGNAEAA